MPKKHKTYLNKNKIINDWIKIQEQNVLSKSQAIKDNIWYNPKITDSQ